MYVGCMNTYEILNDTTGEVVETADSYQDALGIAAYLTDTTRVLHFVPVGVEKELTYAV